MTEPTPKTDPVMRAKELMAALPDYVHSNGPSLQEKYEWAIYRLRDEWEREVIELRKQLEAAAGMAHRCEKRAIEAEQWTDKTVSDREREHKQRADGAEHAWKHWRERAEAAERQLAERNENAARLQAGVDILLALVTLKHYKDVIGKDAHYESEQPKAWALARDYLRVAMPTEYAAIDAARLAPAGEGE